MVEVKINGNKVQFYDNIKTLPIRRYQQSNKHLMVAADIGSDFTDFDKRSLEITEFLQKGMLPEAIKSIENRRQSVWNAFQNYNPKGMALAVMVYSINGIEKKDFSDSGLEQVLDELNEIGFNYGDMIDNLSDVKKKSKLNLKHIFRNSLRKMKTRFSTYILSRNSKQKSTSSLEKKKA